MSQNLSAQCLSKALNPQFWIREKENGFEVWTPNLFSIKKSHNLFSFYILEEFVYHFVQESDQNKILKSIHTYIKNGEHFEIEFRLRKHNHKYHWLLCKLPRLLPDILSPNTYFIWYIGTSDKKTYLIRYDEDKYFFQIATEMTGTSSWFMNFVQKKTCWDMGVRKVLENLKKIKPSIKLDLSYFTKPYRFEVKLENAPLLI